MIPPGSYVTGTVTEVKRPGRIKGRGELYLRFDSLTLPNGVTRDFRARIGGMEGGGSNELDRDEGKIKGGGSKGKDARDIAQAAQMGTMVGGIAGAVSGRPFTGLAGGAGAGAAAGLAGVLLRASRCPCFRKAAWWRWCLIATCSTRRRSWISAAHATRNPHHRDAGRGSDDQQSQQLAAPFLGVPAACGGGTLPPPLPFSVVLPYNFNSLRASLRGPVCALAIA